MEFFGAGFAAGIGAGIAIGMPTGAKQAREKFERYLESEGITLQGPQGNQVDIDDALSRAIQQPDAKERKSIIILLVIGLGVLTAVGLTFYFLFAR